MGKWLKVAGLAAVALMVAASASGDSNTYNYQGSGPYFNTKNGAVVDASGNAKVVDADRDRDYWTLIGSVNDTLNSAMGVAPTGFARLAWTAESTTVAAAYPYKRFALVMRVIPAGGDTTQLMKFAIQVRAHTSAVADSENTFAWQGWTAATNAAASDSIGSFFSGTFAPGASAAAAAGNPSTCWPSERMVAFSPKRGRGGFAFNGIFGWPDGQMINLVDPNGNWFWAPYVSVRVRMLFGTGPVRVILKLYGGA